MTDKYSTDSEGCLAGTILAVAVLVWVIGCAVADVGRAWSGYDALRSPPPATVDKWAPDSVMGRLHKLESDMYRLQEEHNEK